MDTNADLPPFDPELLTRVLAGHASATERRIVERWAAEHPRNAGQWSGLQEVWRAAERPQHSEGTDVEVLVQKILKNVAGQERAHTVSGVGTRPTREKTANLGIRALRQGIWSLGGLIIAGFIFMTFGLRLPSRNRGVTRTYTTTQSESASLILGDGTHVTLAPRTTLRLVDFGPQSRTVTLVGTALFEVEHSSGVPFIVQAGVTETRVLGTKFLVRYQGEKARTHVAVVSGKVLVIPMSRLDNGVTLTAGQMGSVRDSVVHANTMNVDPSHDWLRDQLVFRDVPIVTVLSALAQWYGYQFLYTDSTLVRHHVTMGVSMQSSMEALATLKQVLNVNVTVHGDTVTLTPRFARPIPKTPRAHIYDLWLPPKEIGR